MKYAVAIFGFAALVSAQAECEAIAASIPSCATACLADALKAVDCGATDYTCQCKPSLASALQTNAQPCISKACASEGVAVLGTVVSAATSVCDCAAKHAGDASSGSEAGTSAPVSSGSATPHALIASSLITEAPYPISPVPTPSGTAASSGISVNATSVYPPISTGGATSVGGKIGAGLVMVVGALAVF
ncbi:MAG: hypothetical protein MMC23_002643 [Stictis urceolatum]|nr:hypothetical protein [Stictis urceolata]